MVGGYIQDLDQDLVTGVAAELSGMDRETDEGNFRTNTVNERCSVLI